ncbi:hypothetical protein [Glycomyces sp. YM15]|uniref:hypothetical protein n=1 Tax=Glycomyces sp. YM15 TaxID=2800446 RepID=UPI001963F0AD|nr:hypothetical protein [Glycomyces sp. YM15]
MTEPLSPAETAVAAALARDFNLHHSDGIARLGPADFTDAARAAVAAAAPLILEHAAASIEAQRAELRSIASRLLAQGDTRADARLQGLDEAAQIVRSLTDHRPDTGSSSA